MVVGTDYEGLGTPGRHPYIAGPSEARGTLDIVRAARNLPDVHASDRYLVWGHSQGGHAAMFALAHGGQVGARAESRRRGGRGSAVATVLVYQALKTSPFKYYLLMAAAGFNAGFGDQAAPLDKVLTPAGLAAIPKVDEGCTDAISKATAEREHRRSRESRPRHDPRVGEAARRERPRQVPGSGQGAAC